MKSVRLIKIMVWRNAIKNNPMLMTLFTITARKKANHTLQTMRLQHLRLCTAANILEPVNDGLQMKQRLIAVWSGLQQTVVDEAVDEWVDEQKISF